MASPYVELYVDADASGVDIVIPAQPNLSVGLDPEPKYNLRINEGDPLDLVARVCSQEDGSARIDELRHRLNVPLSQYEIVYPDALGARSYRYSHHSEAYFAFVAVGDNRGRLRRFDPASGAAGALPQRMVWLLLRRNLKPETEPPPLAEDCWIWNEYRLWRVDLRNAVSLQLKHDNGDVTEARCRACARLEGSLVSDDFAETEPLFTGGELKVVPPPEDFTCEQHVWLQGRAGTPKMLNYEGNQPRTLRLPDDLPCVGGHFQLDICRRNGDVDTVLFFRWLPSVSIDYPTTLVLPNADDGHTSAEVKLRLADTWEVANDKQYPAVRDDGGYCLQVEPDRDTVQVTVAQTGRPETATVVQVTIPRLKWRIGGDAPWRGNVISIPHKKLVHEEPMILAVRTNDCKNTYDIEAILEIQGEQVQAAKLSIRHEVDLSRFFDTIRSWPESSLTLRVLDERQRLVGKVIALHFSASESPTSSGPGGRSDQRPAPVARVRARGCGRLRKAGGFSRAEVSEVGLDIRTARRKGIRVDHRRKTAHTWNIDALRLLLANQKE